MTNCTHCHQPQSAAPVICHKCYEELTVKTVSVDDKKLIEELRRRGLGRGTSLGHHSGICDAAADRIEELTAQLSDARNELCQRCGKYKMAHKGACDGCRWRKTT